VAQLDSLGHILRMEHTSPIQTAKRIAWCCAALPLVELVLFYSFVLRARLSLGIWPAYNHPDPKLLGFGFHYDLVAPFLILFLWSAIPVLIIAGVLWLGSRRLSWWVVFFPVMVSFAGAFALHYFDPGGFFGWFID